MTLSFREPAWLPFHMGRPFILPHAGIIQAFGQLEEDRDHLA
ncbi:MAG: hypothetical protein ACJA16_004608 [Akkermansiaceae bacterium]|jgi:hypothetical protein